MGEGFNLSQFVLVLVERYPDYGRFTALLDTVSVPLLFDDDCPTDPDLLVVVDACSGEEFVEVAIGAEVGPRPRAGPLGDHGVCPEIGPVELEPLRVARDVDHAVGSVLCGF